jgi:hypothetical protein
MSAIPWWPKGMRFWIRVNRDMAKVYGWLEVIKTQLAQYFPLK